MHVPSQGAVLLEKFLAYAVSLAEELASVAGMEGSVADPSDFVYFLNQEWLWVKE